jgi:hypothetical protein
MSIGSIFMLIAVIVFFVIGANIVKIDIVWGFFLLSLGLLLMPFKIPGIKSD